MIEGAGGLDTLAGMVLRAISLASPSRSIPALGAGSRIIIECLQVCGDIDEFRPEKPSGKLPPLCAAMPARNAVESLTVALRALTRTTALDLGMSLETIVWILTSIFLSPGGLHRVPDAARNGFFQVIIDVGGCHWTSDFISLARYSLLVPCTTACCPGFRKHSPRLNNELPLRLPPFPRFQRMVRFFPTLYPVGSKSCSASATKLRFH
jgi:hypothetical protein